MENFRFAVKEITPLIFLDLFFGIAIGLLYYESGYSIIFTLLAAVFIYSGSMQILLISLLLLKVPLVMVILISFFINARHVFYGIRFVESFQQIGGWKYPYMVLAMSDATYSVLCSTKPPPELDADKIKFSMVLLLHIIWVMCCVLGAIFGEILPFKMQGIEFSATACFMAFMLKQWYELKSAVPIMIGVMSSILFFIVLGKDQFMLPALILSVILLLGFKEKIVLRLEGGNHE